MPSLRDVAYEASFSEANPESVTAATEYEVAEAVVLPEIALSAGVSGSDSERRLIGDAGNETFGGTLGFSISNGYITYT